MSKNSVFGHFPRSEYIVVIQPLFEFSDSFWILSFFDYLAAQNIYRESKI